MTTDFRSVFRDALQGALGPANINQVFPGFNGPTKVGIFG